MVRFLDAEARDLIPRKLRQWSTSRVSKRMRDALVAAERPIPAWFELAVIESDTSKRKTLYFDLPDAVAGETRLGLFDGVVGTWIHTHGDGEVVEVRFDPRVTTAEDLQAAAEGLGGGPSASTNATRTPSGRVTWGPST